MKVDNLYKSNKVIADVAVWGHPPPPYGGMSVHIERLVPKLNNEGIKVQMYNLSDFDYYSPHVRNYSNNKFAWITRLLFKHTEKVHYVLSVRPVVRLLAVLYGMFRKKKIILRIGGASLHKSVYGNSKYLNFISKLALQNADAVIGVNKDICEIALKLGVKSEKIYNIPGFIPPYNNKPAIPVEILSFIKLKSPILLITGILPTINDFDVYGIRDSIQVMQIIKKYYPNAGLVIYPQDIKGENNDGLKILQNVIESNNLSSSILIHNSNSDLWPVFKVVNVFLRPSYSDGDANSIRESIYFGVPVVASDCVKRPDVVEIFSTGNNGEYLKAINRVVSNLDYYRKITKEYEVIDNSKITVDLIKKLLNGDKK